MQRPVLAEISIAEIGLRFSRAMLERKIALLLLQAEFLSLFGNVSCYKAVGTVVTLCLAFQTIMDPLRSVPLLTRCFLVFGEPFVDDRLELIQL